MFSSTFAMRYKLAAQAVGANTKHDGFDTGIIEVANKDYGKFMQNLTSFNE